MTTTVDGTPVVVPLCPSDAAGYLADCLAEQVRGGTNVLLYPDFVPYEAWAGLLRSLMDRSQGDCRFKIVIYGGNVTLLHPAENLAIS